MKKKTFLGKKSFYLSTSWFFFTFCFFTLWTTEKRRIFRNSKQTRIRKAF